MLAGALHRAAAHGRFRTHGLVLVVAVLGCAPPGAQNAGPGGRPQHLALTPAQEERLGVEAYQEVLSQNQVVRGGPDVEHVRTVGRRIADVATGQSQMSRLLRREINLHVDPRYYHWEFNVLRGDQVNAFCLPGGKVAVFTGLFQVTRDRNDLLAVVLGHEVAHALAHHASERIYRAEMTDRALRVLGTRGGMGSLDGGEQNRLLGLMAAGTQFNSLAFDRRQESEADHIGVFLMTFAGYDPQAAVEFWGRMRQTDAGRPRLPEIFSDHPSDARRLAQLRIWADQARAAKKAYDEGRVAPDS
jgi:predicted Zn-dependent protease